MLEHAPAASAAASGATAALQAPIVGPTVLVAPARAPLQLPPLDQSHVVVASALPAHAALSGAIAAPLQHIVGLGAKQDLARAAKICA